MNRERSVDVVVIGSGGAGILAGLRARDRGCEVVVLEKTDKVGGTTAVSGGMLWIPRNHHMRDLGVSDSREEALLYLRRISGDQTTEELLNAFVEHSPEMVRYLEQRTPVRFRAISRPDYHPEWAGGKISGRTLDNELFDTTQLAEHREVLRRSPHYPPITYQERHEWSSVEKFDWALIARRMEAGVVTLGGALAGGLFKAALDAGIEFLVGAPAVAIDRTARGVSGVKVRRGRDEMYFEAKKAVIVASGGFEWNQHMKTHFLRGPLLASATPPWSTGDGIQMGMAIGASLGNMNEAGWFPVLRIPGEEYDGHPVARLIVEERSKPGSIIVNRSGRRFVNEAISYNDIIKAFHHFDPDGYTYANLPAYLVFDQRFRARYNLATIMPSDRPPAWFKVGDTVKDLGRSLGVDAGAFEATVERFNKSAVQGLDPDFRRGESAHDRYYGDPEHRPNPCIAPIDTPPYFAVELLPGSVGTKGGLLTDALGRVLDSAREVIPGLYACGNAMSSSMGIGYPGAGGMLGPGMTFGYIAGDDAGGRPQ